MRWRTPRSGDVRVVRRWAFPFPVQLDNGQTIWLERYWAREFLSPAGIRGKLRWGEARRWQ